MKNDADREGTFELDDFYWEIFLPHSEDLQVAEDRLLCLRVAVNFNTQEVTLILPVEFALKRSCEPISDGAIQESTDLCHVE